MKVSSQKLSASLRLMRLHRPIGIYLVLWPTLSALWLAAEGVPSTLNLIIFVLGTVLMRSAGCVINDYADRKVDGHVRRTLDRPIVRGELEPTDALLLFAILCLLAFGLVLLTNTFTILLSFGALALAACYPFMKRYTQLPQLVLGAAFAWSVPMAFAAQTGQLDQRSWLLYTAVVLWTVAYDTFYAMVDRDDDLKIGVKSTAILFGDMDRVITGTLQVLTLLALVLLGRRFELGAYYFAGLGLIALLFIYQQYLIRNRAPEACFRAFLNNNVVGMALFAGIALDYALP